MVKEVLEPVSHTDEFFIFVLGIGKMLLPQLADVSLEPLYLVVLVQVTLQVFVLEDVLQGFLLRKVNFQDPDPVLVLLLLAAKVPLK